MFQWVVLEFNSNLKKCPVFLRQYHPLWERTAMSREFGTSQSPLNKGAEPSHFRFYASLGLKLLQKYKYKANVATSSKTVCFEACVHVSALNLHFVLLVIIDWIFSLCTVTTSSQALTMVCGVWLAPLPHSKKVLGLKPLASWGQQTLSIYSRAWQ